MLYCSHVCSFNGAFDKRMTRQSAAAERRQTTAKGIGTTATEHGASHAHRRSQKPADTRRRKKSLSGSTSGSARFTSHTVSSTSLPRIARNPISCSRTAASQQRDLDGPGAGLGDEGGRLKCFSRAEARAGFDKIIRITPNKPTIDCAGCVGA